MADETVVESMFQRPHSPPDHVEWDGSELVCYACEESIDWRRATNDEVRQWVFDHSSCPPPYDAAGAWDDDDDLIDGVGFADPGGRSALRAATADNPRNRPCPTCRQPNRLTPLDVAHGYQCDECADRAERGEDGY